MANIWKRPWILCLILGLTPAIGSVSALPADNSSPIVGTQSKSLLLEIANTLDAQQYPTDTTALLSVTDTYADKVQKRQVLARSSGPLFRVQEFKFDGKTQGDLIRDYLCDGKRTTQLDVTSVAQSAGNGVLDHNLGLDARTDTYQRFLDSPVSLVLRNLTNHIDGVSIRVGQDGAFTINCKYAGEHPTDITMQIATDGLYRVVSWRMVETNQDGSGNNDDRSYRVTWKKNKDGQYEATAITRENRTEVLFEQGHPVAKPYIVNSSKVIEVMTCDHAEIRDKSIFDPLTLRIPKGLPAIDVNSGVVYRYGGGGDEEAALADIVRGSGIDRRPNSATRPGIAGPQASPTTRDNDSDLSASHGVPKLNSVGGLGSWRLGIGATLSAGLVLAALAAVAVYRRRRLART